jgi:hypothetical protein
MEEKRRRQRESESRSEARVLSKHGRLSWALVMRME